ncbi:MAG: AraC family ligand binding domain-containing protein [Myxococcales bacterium]|nr:AraC family ligand binding domain-containing protein [Myxococcales bacterium]
MRRAPRRLAAFGVAAALLLCATAQAQGRGLDTVVGAAIKRGYAALHGCYRKLAAIDRGRGGTVFVEVVLGGADRIASAKVVRDEIKSKTLGACLAGVVARWRLAGAGAAGARAGNTIVIPLTFRASPRRPSVSVSDLVAAPAGAGVSARALLTRRNSGARKATMRLLSVQKRLALAPTPKADRALVVLRGRGSVRSVRGGRLRAGSTVSIPAGRAVTVRGRGLELLQVTVPLARNAKVGAAERVRVVAERRKRGVKLAGGKLRIMPLLDRQRLGHQRFYLGRLRAAKGLKVPEHMHLTEAEVLYLARGGGRFFLEGERHVVAGQMGIYIPSGKMHAMLVDADLDSVQVYAPAGPEQRFFKKKKK